MSCGVYEDAEHLPMLDVRPLRADRCWDPKSTLSVGLTDTPPQALADMVAIGKTYWSCDAHPRCTQARTVS